VKASILKKAALLGFVALASVASAASDDARAVRRLQEKAGANSLVPLSANREEIALALADVAATSGQPQADLSGWNAKDYDALFALLQQYREDLAALGLRQAAVDTAMDALRKRIADLEQRMEYLPPDGMKIHGGFTVLADDLLITGPGQNLGRPTRFRHFKQYGSLEFTAIHGPFLGVAEMDYANYVYSYAATALGVRRAYVELRTPIAFQSGDFAMKYTPLTLWRNEDEDPYAPEPFKGRAVRLRDDLLLNEDHALMMRGLRLLTEVVMGETHALELEAYASLLDSSGTSAYTTANRTSAGNSGPDYLANYTTILAGWKVGMDVVPGWHLAYVGVKMYDDKDTGNTAYGTDIAGVLPQYSYLELQTRGVEGFDNEVHSVNTSFSFLDDSVKGQAEYAISRYANPNIAFFPDGQTGTAGTPNYFANKEFQGGGYLPGTAMNASLTLGPKWAKFTASMRQVDESFVAPAAQTRTLDRNRTPYGPFYTENSQFNPTGSDYSPYVGVNLQDYAETQFNTKVVPPFTHFPSHKPNFNYLVPYDVGWEASAPYGLATPNRSGYGAELAFNFWKGGFQPDIKVEMSQQIEGEGNMYDSAGAIIPGTVRPPEKYLMARAGMILDLKPMVDWPLKFVAGYRIESIDGAAPWAPELPPSAFYPNGLPAALVNFDSTRLDLGLEYYPVKTTGLFLGYRHLDYNGTTYDPDATYSPRGQYGLMQEYETMGVGLRHFMGNDRIIIDLLYSNQVFPDRDLALTLGKVVAYEVEQIYNKISVRF
jgi:hypothetical protein